MTPAFIVQRQRDACNAKEIGALMVTYAQDVQQFEHPATLVADGTAHIRERFVTRSKEPNLHARRISHIMARNTVPDHERVTQTFPESLGKIELIAICGHRNSKARSIFGVKTVGAECSP